MFLFVDTDMARKSKTAVAQQLNKLGIDPVAEAVSVATDSSCPHVVRAKIWCELIQYIQPKLKSVEISNKDDKPFQLKLPGIELVVVDGAAAQD